MHLLCITVMFAISLNRNQRHLQAKETTNERRIAFHFFYVTSFKYQIYISPFELPGKGKLCFLAQQHTHLFLPHPSIPDQLSPLFLKILPKLLEHLNMTYTIQLSVVYILTFSLLLHIYQAGLLSYGVAAV